MHRSARGVLPYLQRSSLASSFALSSTLSFSYAPSLYATQLRPLSLRRHSTLPILSLKNRPATYSSNNGFPFLPSTSVRRFLSQSPLSLARGDGSIHPYQGRQRAPGSWENVMSSANDSLTPEVREHLMRVYNLLAMGIGTAAIGSAAMILTPLGGIIPYWLPLFGGFVPMLWLVFKPPADPALRGALYFAFTMLEGMALAPVVKITATAGVLGTALVLTGAVFLGFSAAAFLAPRASLLALQGPLFGCLIGMVAISVLNMFWPIAFAHSLLLYGGLALFSVFIAADTQAMIERARCGVSDPVGDALRMFLNVVNIFVRIAEILRSMAGNS